MSRKTSASERVTINRNGEHCHRLGVDGIPSKRRKLILTFFQRESSAEDRDRLISSTHRDIQNADLETTTQTESFPERYGICKGIIHYGNNSTVRLHRPSVNELYAVKVYNRSHPISEVTTYIGLDLRHLHVVEMNEFLRDKRGYRCLGMEYCAGGDLLSLILSSESGRLEKTEADCFFKQTVQGVEYIHEKGIAHQNLQPESIALTASGCVKIIDFDRAQSVFAPSEFKKKTRLSVYLYSHQNSSYTAPEEYFRFSQTDHRASDVWAAGIVYLAMRRGHMFWNVAQARCDARYDEYVKRRSEESFEPIESLEEVSLDHQNILLTTIIC